MKETEMRQETIGARHRIEMEKIRAKENLAAEMRRQIFIAIVPTWLPATNLEDMVDELHTVVNRIVELYGANEVLLDPME